MFKNKNKHAYVSKFDSFMNIVYISVLAFALLLAIILGTLKFTGHEAMHIISNSMQPTFSKGDMVIVDTQFEDIQLQDVIAYNADWKDAIITHRVIYIEETGDLIAKGDSNMIADPPVAKESVIGTISLSIPKVGYLVEYNIPIYFVLGVVALTVIEFLKSAITERNPRNYQPRHGNKV